MNRPMAIQPNSRTQLSQGSENISIRQLSTPMIGTNGTHGQRNGRSAFGYFLRMINTAAQTITNANSVPMFVSRSSASIGSKPAMTTTPEPMRMVAFQGVRNFGCTSPKNDFETSPSRAIARNTRGAESIITSMTDVIPATPAQAMIPSAQPIPFCLKARLTGALMSSWLYLTIPVSTATTAMYRTVQ